MSRSRASGALVTLLLMAGLISSPLASAIGSCVAPAAPSCHQPAPSCLAMEMSGGCCVAVACDGIVPATQSVPVTSVVTTVATAVEILVPQTPPVLIHGDTDQTAHAPPVGERLSFLSTFLI